jgi:hypothetical protein
MGEAANGGRANFKRFHANRNSTLVGDFVDAGGKVLRHAWLMCDDCGKSRLVEHASVSSLTTEKFRDGSSSSGGLFWKSWLSRESALDRWQIFLRTQGVPEALGGNSVDVQMASSVDGGLSSEVVDSVMVPDERVPDDEFEAVSSDSDCVGLVQGEDFTDEVLDPSVRAEMESVKELIGDGGGLSLEDPELSRKLATERICPGRVNSVSAGGVHERVDVASVSELKFSCSMLQRASSSNVGGAGRAWRTMHCDDVDDLEDMLDLTHMMPWSDLVVGARVSLLRPGESVSVDAGDALYEKLARRPLVSQGWGISHWHACRCVSTR